MRVFLSTDMEGTAGIVDWAQCRGPGAAYEASCTLLLDEVNAAIEGCLAGGADDVLVNDSHGHMANLAAGQLSGRARYLSGRHKPLYMMEGLDSSFAAVGLVSYHGSMGSSGVLSHTYNPRAVYEVRLNGTPVGEAGVNALVAQAAGVPVAFVTGDEVTIAETSAVLPGAEGVAVKRSVTRFAAESLHPAAACEAIRAGAQRGVQRAASNELAPPDIALPASLEVDWLTVDMADMATWVGGVERLGRRTVRISGTDPLAIYRGFVATVAITRSIVEA